jgi:transposase, IS5 family
LFKIPRKPRCNSVKAHNLFLVIKKKKASREEILDAKRFQLNEISRNLRAIDGMIHCGAKLSALGSQLYRKLLIAS